MRKRATAAFMILFAFFALCAPASAARRNILRVGTDADFPPYEYYQKESGAYTGFDIELVEALAPLMGYDGVEFVQIPFDEILEALNEGRCDAAAAALVVTAERRRMADFTAPYAEDRAAVLALPGDAAEGAKGATAAEKGTVYMKYAADHYAQQGGIIGAEGAEGAAALLLSGRAGRAVTSKLSAEYLIANVYGGRIEICAEDGASKPIAIAVRKGDGALLGRFNAALARFMNSSAYEMLYTTYFGAED